MVGSHPRKRSRVEALTRLKGDTILLSSPARSSHRKGRVRSLLPRFVCTAVLVGSWSSRWRASYGFGPTTKPIRQHQQRSVGGLYPLNLESSTECSEIGNDPEQFHTINGSNSGLCRIGSAVACSIHEDLTSSSLLPPWLERFQYATHDQLHEEIRSLEFALLQEHGFSVQDVAEVVNAIYFCGGVADAHGRMGAQEQRVGKILGSITFCKLLLRLEAETEAEQQYPKTAGKSFGVDRSTSRLRRSHLKSTPKNDLVSKDVLLASILHYSECVTARYEGVYDQVQYAVSRGVTNSRRDLISGYGPASATSMPQIGQHDEDAALVWEVEETTNIEGTVAGEGIFSFSSLPGRTKDDAPEDPSSRRNTVVTSGRKGNSEIFTADSLLLAQSASRLKRTEIVTNVLLTGNRPLTTDEYKAIQTLLVSLTDDWRALAIRCVASLYRLEAIVQGIPMGTGEYIRHRNPEAILTAKESLRVYANLSNRLGLHRLQTQLEARAFQVLYPRQYSAASALFHEHGTSMTAISLWLTKKLEKMLREDSSLMYELEDVQVLSRVKEPFSFWKKLMKNRIVSSPVNDDSTMAGNTQRFLAKQAKGLSIVDVNDGVALRVILKARKLHGDESDETTRARERMLCYYVQDLVRSHWPETDESRVKDYIRYPKANGYQSLHHTSKITRNEQEFFFEVQIRSEEMHRLAEFGVAAHWTYKSGSTHPALAAPYPEETPIQSIHLNGEASLPQLSSDSSGVGLVPRLSPRKSDGRSAPSIVSDESLYVRALGEARQSLMQSQVYVFLAGPSSPLDRGRLLSLPVGSLIIDVISFLRSTEDFPFRLEELQVRRNGNLARFEETVRNGDMVVVLPPIPNEKLLVGRMQMEEDSSLVA